ncbi:MAG: site-2 protease family protein, partial [Microbacteriaceae bacterium]|nr:site-2 protease family protein [Microbacteriaceae bacterium]
MHILWYLLGILVFALLLTLSVALHELGHMLTGKLFGVKVTEYMIGFGPKLWSRRWGETEYGLKAIPAGGYTALIGMYPPARVAKPYRGPFAKLVREAREASDATIGPGEDARTFYRLPVWKRLVVMVAGVVANLVLAVVFFLILVMGIGQMQPTTTLGTISECVQSSTTSQR